MIPRIAIACVVADVAWHVFREHRVQQETETRGCYVDRVYAQLRAKRMANLMNNPSIAVTSGWYGGGGGGFTIAPGTITFTSTTIHPQPPKQTPGGTP